MIAQIERKNFGADGERIVADQLQKQGFSIYTQNYRKFFGEIDIIAYKKNLYIFVEVKTRRSYFTAMKEIISYSKQKKIIKTAQTFIAEHNISQATLRFDVAFIIKNNDTFTIEYIENAFTQSEKNYDY